MSPQLTYKRDMALLPFEQVRDGLSDPAIFPQNLDLGRQAILFLRLSRAELEAASFLDDRILTPNSQGRWVRFPELAPLLASPPSTRPLHYIFHTGHVGSTLVSRLLDEAGVLGLREPVAMRALADAFDQAQAGQIDTAQIDTISTWLATLWSRGFADTNAVVLKATSSAGRIAPQLLRTSTGARAIYLNLKAEPYLATLLAGENTPLDLQRHGPERRGRLARLASASPTPLEALSLGELAALTWLTETLTQHQAQRVHGDRVLTIDFDAFLAAPGDALRAICMHFALQPSPAFFDSAPDSPVLKRYSKSPEHPYTPALRAEILAQSRTGNADEIGKGLRWLDRFAQQSPAAAAVLTG